TSPLHDALTAKNAVFGVSFGLETPLYFGRKGEPAAEVPTLHRSNAFPSVAEECRAAREEVAVMDISSFGKYEVVVPQAAAVLDRLLAGHLPGIGRIRLTPMLSKAGRLMGDLTTARLDENRFMIFGSGYLQTWHMRWFGEHLADDGVSVRNLSDEWLGL